MIACVTSVTHINGIHLFYFRKICDQNLDAYGYCYYHVVSKFLSSL